MQNLISRSFLFFWRTCLLFISSPLVWWCPFPLFPNTSKFSFLQVFWFSLDLAVLFLLLFHLFPVSLCPCHIFLGQIPFLYSNCLFILIQIFFIFGRQLDTVPMHKLINHFLWFCEFVAPSTLSKCVIMWHHYYYQL